MTQVFARTIVTPVGFQNIVRFHPTKSNGYLEACEICKYTVEEFYNICKSEGYLFAQDYHGYYTLVYELRSGSLFKKHFRTLSECIDFLEQGKDKRKVKFN